MATTTEIVLNPEKEYEIVAGQPEEKEMGGARHGGVGARLIGRLGMHVEAHRLGGVYGPDTTFQMGQNERIPDVSFVSAARIPEGGEPEGIWPIAPDLAVEIISPNDLFEKVISKMREYFAAGVRQVWLISPEHKTVTIYRSPTQDSILSEEDELVGDDVVPGFRCRISELFQHPVRT
ncbi:MAG: Uma2 family endonuclease [Candidatus Tectomicrobia bacterium]|nr:Uma2 family endonuclease [Candidatus Tectomicrobia bacterium]